MKFYNIPKTNVSSFMPFVLDTLSAMWIEEASVDDVSLHSRSIMQANNLEKVYFLCLENSDKKIQILFKSFDAAVIEVNRIKYFINQADVYELDCNIEEWTVPTPLSDEKVDIKCH